MSYSFDGTNDWLTASASPHPASNAAYSYHIWAYPDVTNANDALMGAKDSSDNDRVSLQLQGTASDVIRASIFDSGVAALNHDNAGPFTSGSWQSFGLSSNGSNSYYVYYDGNQSAESTTLITPDGLDSGSSGVFEIGQSDGASPFDGYLAEAVIFSTQMPAAAFTDLANGAHPEQVVIDHGGTILFYADLEDNLTVNIGSYTLSATGSPTQNVAHPTIDAAPSGGSIIPLLNSYRQRQCI